MEVSPAWNTNQLHFKKHNEQSKDITKVLRNHKELLFDLLSQPMELKVEYNGDNWKIISSGNKEEMMQAVNKINDALIKGHSVFALVHQEFESNRQFCIKFYNSSEPLKAPEEYERFKLFLAEEIYLYSCKK